MNTLSDLILDHLGKFISVLVVFFYALLFFISSASCHAKWEGSGHATRWGPIMGCQVQRDDGTWVPASALRDIDL